MQNFDPYKYIVDVEKHKNEAYKTAKELIRTSGMRFDRDSILKRFDAHSKEEYKWFTKASLNLFAPQDQDEESQLKEINEFVEKLKTSAKKLKHEFLPNLLPEGYEEPIIGLDTETTGLDTRVIYGLDGKLDIKTELVGTSVAVSDNEGFYLPVKHSEEDGVYNWTKKAIIHFLERVNMEFCTIIHNAAYDRQVLALNGVQQFRPTPYFFDTMILYYLLNTDRKSYGLKTLSHEELGRKMIDIWDLFEDNKEKSTGFIRFDFITATNSYMYAASDATNTYALFKNLLSKYKEHKTNPMFTQPKPIIIDHKFTDTLITLYRQGHPVDVDISIKSLKDLIVRIKLLEDKIYKEAGLKFKIGSSKVLGELIYDKMKIPPLDGAERGKNGCYSTDEATLEGLQERNPQVVFLNYIVQFRKLNNAISKFFGKFIRNSYVDALHGYTRMNIQYSQVRAHTGRLASSSSGQLEMVKVKALKKEMKYEFQASEGTCGFNSQAIPSDPYITKKRKKLTKIPPEVQQRLDQLNKGLDEDFIVSLVTDKSSVSSMDEDEE